MRWLIQEPSTHASHRAEQQPQAHNKQLTCASSQKSLAPMQAASASYSSKLTASDSLCCLTQEPSTHASHRGNHPLRAHRKQLTCAGSHKSSAPSKPQRQATAASSQRAANCAGSYKGPAPCKPQRRATAASTRQAANMCWLTEPSTHARHKGTQQLQAHSKQQNVRSNTRAQHPRKPQR